MKINLPENVVNIINILESSGFECYLVGGSVRDILLKLEPKDYDLTTNAKPEEILSVFSDYKTFDAGIKHGTVSVVMNDEVYEITTYRIDGDYLDNRHPEKVEFTTSLKKDLARRDFTINAVAYNPRLGFVDYFNGIKDIKYNAIRCVGDPDTRFKEDALRILRALRFASVYGFSIEFNTLNAIAANKKLLNNISQERISSEFVKILCGKKCDYVLRRFKDVFAVIVPEIATMFNFNQNNPHHSKTLWKHTVSAVKNVENTDILRVTMLFHDIGKPIVQTIDKNGVSHYKGHPKISAAMTKVILKRLRFSNSFIDKVTLLITYHDLRLKPDNVEIKKVLKIIGKDNFALLMTIQLADIMAQSNYKREEKLIDHQNTCRLFDEIICSHQCYSLNDLAISGSDLLHSGISDGKKIGETLDNLLNMVIEEKVNNNREELLSLIKDVRF
ncbi:MAG: HD domain-containing protein [Oscillospiraceae bacterium]|nr:HD domain-containing protein [Oscillospiraceae bacterium]